MYSCSYSECEAKKRSTNESKAEEVLIPLRLLVCGHSVCELCVLQLCKRNASFIKCSICGFNTTITETVSRNMIQCETDIKKWLHSSGSVGQVLRMDMNLFPLDLYSIACGVNSGLITASKTPLTFDIDIEDEVMASNDMSLHSTQDNCLNPCSGLADDDITVKSILSKVPKTASKGFHESVNKGVNTFIDLGTNHTSIKRNCDETKEWFKKLRINTKETFHRLHSILQLRERELFDEIDSNQEMRLNDLKIFMNEILSKRSELKGKLLQCSQALCDNDKKRLRKSIEQLVKDSNILNLNSPQNEYKLIFDSKLETQLKLYGTVETSGNSGEEMYASTEDDIQDISGSKRADSPISVSSDDEDISYVSAEGDQTSQQTINREIVTVLHFKNPHSFYVQKASDKERFDYLTQQITQICSSAYYHAPAIETLAIGEKLFSFSAVKKCWCRATLIHYREVENEENSFLADVFLIDYGISETVNWYNIREKKIEFFDDKKWSPFVYKCALFNIKPNNRANSHEWSTYALELFGRYVTNNQLVMFIFETKDGVNLVDLIHYDVPEVTYQIPSLIEILVNYEYALLNGNIEFSSYSRYKCQTLKYPDPEVPKTLKTVSVLVSHVESPDLFYVQLQRQHNNLLKLIDELNRTYDESNVGIYTYYCPKMNTPCAALFEGDRKFYRALTVQKGKSVTETVVQFVDFGNKQTVQNCNLRLIKDDLIKKLPIQNIPCYLIHVEPSYGYKWSQNATDDFRFAISNDRGPQILTMCVYDIKLNKLGVVLRSYDGDKGVKVNEILIKRKNAISSGPLSLPDDERGRVMGSQESLNSINSSSSSRNRVQTAVTLPFKVSAFIVMREMFERSKLAKADKRSSLIEVTVSHATDPSNFYVQINKSEIKSYFQEMEKLLHEEYSSSRYRHLGDTNFVVEDLCAFKIDGNWRRGQVLERLNNLTTVEVPEEQRFKVLDIDYGFEHHLKVSQMRRLREQFTKDGSFAVKCRLALLRPTGGSDWSHSANDEFKDSIKRFEKSLLILVKETQITGEPISVKLYGRESIIPGAFEKQKIVYHSMSQILADKGLAAYEKSKSSLSESDCESNDDNDINEETPTESRTQMPFSLYSQSNENLSVLESLHQRHQQTNDSNAPKFFKYIDEVYPVGEREFFGIPTDIDNNPGNFCISFRYFEEGVNRQPLQSIESSILAAINSKGELEPFSGPFTKDNACTAYFEFDKSWNRAEIVGISQKSHEVFPQLNIRFVDYGNINSILVDKLSSEIFGIDVPKLALKCKLSHMNPVNEEAVVSIRNELHYILDKKCKFYWENHPELPMIASLEICDQNSYVSLKSILLEKNLIFDDQIDENKSIHLIEEMKNIRTLVKESYGLYPVKFDSTKFYKVVLSQHLLENYAFFQADEKRHPNNEEVIINHEHDEFVWTLDSMRKNVNSFKLLQKRIRGLQ